MAATRVDPVAADVFAHYYALVESGESGMVPKSTIEPVDMPSLADVDVPRRPRATAWPAPWWSS